MTITSEESTRGGLVARDWAAAPEEYVPLPADLVRQAAQRVKFVALCGVLLFGTSVLVAAVDHLRPEGPTWADHGYHLLEGAAVILLAILWWLLKGERLAPQRRVDVGTALQLLVAGFIAFLESDRLIRYEEWAFEPPTVGVSVLAIWVMIFPIIAPQNVTRTVIISGLVAATLPAAAGIRAWGTGVLALREFAYWEVPVLLAAGFAVITAAIVNNLRRKVAHARMMGSYRLVEKIGEGGMGEVWRAEHRMLARPAAVKLIRPERLTAGRENVEQLLKRFELEATATAKLRSPHTVELYDYGRAADGSFFYVMEYLDGVDLDTLVRAVGPLPQGRAAFILEQVCASLADAHQHGLVHRDIKPANIMVCRMGSHFDFVKILDFGLVRTKGIRVRGEAGPLMGTPAYMPPEMLDDAGEAGPPADLYGVGCVGYYLLTSSTLFPDRPTVKVLQGHAREKPEAPSLRAGDQNEVHPHLEAVIMACLEKDPDSRPRSAGAVLEGLRDLALPAPWTNESARTWWRERPHFERNPIGLAETRPLGQ